MTGESVVLMRHLLVDSWVRDGHQKDQVIIRSLDLSTPTPHILEREEGAGDGVNNQSCLHDEASIKIPKVQRLINKQVAILGRWHT